MTGYARFFSNLVSAVGFRVFSRLAIQLPYTADLLPVILVSLSRVKQFNPVCPDDLTYFHALLRRFKKIDIYVRPKCHVFYRPIQSSC